MEFNILAILTIVMVDLVLGIDNAIVIAMKCVGLKKEDQSKAMFIGTLGAIIARIVLLFVGFILVSIPFIKLVAGLYLVYLAYNMFKPSDDEEVKEGGKSVYSAIIAIVIADIVMSIDNVIAVVSASSGSNHNITISDIASHSITETLYNIYDFTVHSDGFEYAVFGILISIPIILIASRVLVGLIEKFPIIMWFGAWLIAYIGFEMIAKERVVEMFLTEHHLTEKAFATVLSIALVVIGLFFNKRKNS